MTSTLNYLSSAQPRRPRNVTPHINSFKKKGIRIVCWVARHPEAAFSCRNGSYFSNQIKFIDSIVTRFRSVVNQSEENNNNEKKKKGRDGETAKIFRRRFIREMKNEFSSPASSNTDEKNENAGYSVSVIRGRAQIYDRDLSVLLLARARARAT